VSVVGAQVFVSHSSKDRARTELLMKLLQGRGFDSLFVDFDPEGGIRPGRNWELELYVNLRRCDAVLAVDSPAWRASPWCFAEIVLARSLGKTVIRVTAGDPGPGNEPGTARLVGDSQGFAVIELGDESLEPVYRELGRLGIGALRSFRWDPGRAPYPGLAPLEELDAGVFFGRRGETRELVDLMERIVRWGEKGMVLLVGPSGSGKSSLLLAGMLPQLRQRSSWQVVGPFRPGADGIPKARAALQTALDSPPPDRTVLVALDQLDETLLGPEQPGVLPFAPFHEVLDEHRGRVLVVGTLRADALAAFDASLGHRTELVHKAVVGPLTQAGYREIIKGPALVAGVEVESGLVDALLGDVLSSGGRAPSGGVSTGAPSAAGLVSTDALPLLAVTLRRLWDRDRVTGRLTLSSYDEMGRLTGAIARTADAVLAASVVDDEDRDGLRRAFLDMVRVDRDGGFTRRPVSLPDVRPRVRELLDRFVGEGLLVTGATPDSIELAHEALIRTWPVLAAWVEEERETLIRVERFEQALAQWREDQRAILEGLNLAAAEELARQGHSVVRGGDARQLLEASQRARDEAAAREREREQAVRISESLRLASEVRSASEVKPETALLVAWEALLWDRNELSEAVFRDALDRIPAPMPVLRPPQGGSTRRTSAGFVADGAAIFAVGADEGDAVVWDSDGTPLGSFAIPGSQKTAAAAVPGLRALMTYRDRLVRLHALDGQVISELALEGDIPFGLGRHPELHVADDAVCLVRDGNHTWLLKIDLQHPQVQLIRTLQFVNPQPNLRLQDYASAEDLFQALAEIPGQGPQYHSPQGLLQAVLAPSGRRVLTQGHDGTTRLWLADGSLLAALKDAGNSRFCDGSFIAGDRFVTGTFAGTGELWDESGSSINVFKQASGDDLFVLAVSRDGQHFATTVNRSGVVELWDASGTLVSTLPVAEQHVWSASFSGDGRYLATGSADRRVCVYDWREQRRVAELQGHTATVNRVAFHPDDPGLLLSACQAGSVRLWTLDPSLLPALPGHGQGVDLMVRTPAGLLTSERGIPSRLWRPDQTTVDLEGRIMSYLPATGALPTAVTLDDAGTLRVWYLPERPGEAPQCTYELPAAARAGLGRIDDVALSPDQTRLTLSDGRTVELWSASGERIGSLIGENDPDVEDEYVRVCGIGFRPEGDRIFTAAENGMVWLWASDGSPIGRFVADYASPDRIKSIAVDPSGEYIAVGVRERAGLWTWNAELGQVLRPRGYKVHRIAFSPDGSRILTISDNPWEGPNHYADLWDRGGQRLAQLDTPEISWLPDEIPDISPWMFLNFDNRGRYFSLASKGIVRLFDPDGRQIGIMAAPQGIDVVDCTLSPDGDNVAALFSDGMVRFWSFGERRPVMSLRTGTANRLIFSADGCHLLTASPAGSIHQHTLDVQDLFPAAAARVRRGLTTEELDRFAIQNPPRLDLHTIRSRQQAQP
jgi:WD40 repeat protein/energy-coupling factor transporter ATP-binding protein EcfA2